LLKRTVNKYSRQGLLLKELVYDASGQFVYENSWDYDAHGNVIKETNALGETIRKEYDENDNPVQPVKLRGNPHGPIVHTEATEPLSPILYPAPALRNIHLELVSNKNSSRLWNEYIDRYHYLGHKSLPGAQLRYFARSEEGLLALFGFGAAAWKVAPRDKFIGWPANQRENNLHLIVNNARFLILPWVKSQHLASKLLGLVARRIADDWMNRYGYRPVLLETFVEKERFAGTCYRAANWTCLGDTQGRGKLDRVHAHGVPIKSIWVYPLTNSFRDVLNRTISGDKNG